MFVHPVLNKEVKLGRTQVKRTPKSRLRMARMTDFMSTLPPAPSVVDMTFGITDWGMMINDTLGDCTIAGPGHMIQSWTASSGSQVTVPDSVILQAYEKWDGYVDGDPSTDNGGDILTVLQDWKAGGLGGRYITASAEVNMTQERIMQALYVFGALNCGVNLPTSAQSQVGKIWEVVGDGQTGDSAPGSWGGHCTAIVYADATKLQCVTWGALQDIAWDFFMLYYDEAHAATTPDFKSPVDATDLTLDLQEIGS